MVEVLLQTSLIDDMESQDVNLVSVMQADILSGKLQLKDSGARLQEGISETAARLAQALSSLAQRGTAETLWPAQSFQSTSIRFIDADGQVQV